MVENVIGHQHHLVCDMLLFERSLAIGLNEALVGDQVAAVVHHEAADVVVQTGRQLLHQQLVEVAQRYVYRHHGRHTLRLARHPGVSTTCNRRHWVQQSYHRQGICHFTSACVGLK
ncbi:hypothetical protein NP493_214g00036 [Ridgeia piscesae]|uniref:Uncharacterized protein n=1 Tax=Ridgeia piscesae TaxID=27915 RepID=A0AAD9P176_RIDPI|nr:hypothetical protein NP493_214g00036 [Ridgeia piscesae]